MWLHVGLVVAGSGSGDLIMARCGRLMVAELVALCGRVVLKTLAQSREVLVSVVVGRWQVAWSWELVAGHGWRMAWSRYLLVFIAISGWEVPMTQLLVAGCEWRMAWL